MSDKLPQIGAVPDSITDPTVRNFLESLRQHVIAAQGGYGVSEKRPTTEELIAAGVTNADKIA